MGEGFSTVGEGFSTVGEGFSTVGIALVLWRLLSTVGDSFSTCRGITSVHPGA